MQSTTTIACRALVMVFCLIAIPLAALFGTSLPDIIETLGWGTTPVSAREQGGDAPLFVANVPDAASAPDSPATGFENNGAAWAGNATRQMESPKLSRDMHAVQAGFNEPAPLYGGANGAVAGTVDRVPVFRPGERPIVPVTGGVVYSDVRPNDVRTSDVVPGGGRFEQIQKRLLDLRATYSRLDTFGSDRKFYRFQCEMPMGGAGAVRHFEATSENSLDAMESVLAEIDRWMTNE